LSIDTRVDGRSVDRLTVEQLRGWTAKQGLLWLDASPPEPADVKYLSAGLHLHPVVIEDIENRNQRPKVEDYDGYMFVVLFGTVRDPSGQLLLAEVHILLGDGWLATVSDIEVPALRQLWLACEKRPEIGQAGASMLFHRICDALVDSVFPILDEIDDEIDRIENNIIERADVQTVTDIFRLKRDLSVLRRVLGPERDLLQILAGPRAPRLDPESQIYLRDVYDHAVRMVEQVDSYRDIVTGALDVYLSSVSNRLGEQSRRLTVVATIFLPLTFLTGFFGMNFAVLVTAISTPQALAAGLIAMAVSVVLVVVVSRRLTARVTPIPVSREGRRLTVRMPVRRTGRRRSAEHVTKEAGN
jgi:magnesium transporter